MEPYKGKNPTDMDWARLAAYIDGEGCVGMKCAVLMELKGRGSHPPKRRIEPELEQLVN